MKVGRVYEIEQNGKIVESEKTEPIEDELGIDGDGTEANPYKICSIEDLYEFSEEVNNGKTYENEYIVLENSLDFYDDNSYIEANAKYYDFNNNGRIETIKEELTTGGFLSIGYSEFKGNFNGKNNQIINYKINTQINNNNDMNRALFRSNGGIISNLNIKYFEYINTLEKIYEITTAGICENNYGVIYNCKMLGNINIKNIQEFGGIVAENRGIILNCENQANIEAFCESEVVMYIAGICDNNEGIIINSSNNANITAKNQYINVRTNIKNRGAMPFLALVSGICSNNSGEINGCFNSGILKGNGVEGFEIGGITVNNYQGKIYNSYNVGDIIGAKSIYKDKYAGMSAIGGNDGGEIYNCYNIGTFKNEDENHENVKIAEDAELISNCYYLENILTEKNEQIIEIKEDEMKNEKFIEMLNKPTNSVLDGKVKFVIDSKKNNGFPVIEANIEFPK